MDSVVEQNHATESNLFITFALAISKPKKMESILLVAGIIWVIFIIYKCWRYNDDKKKGLGHYNRLLDEREKHKDGVNTQKAHEVNNKSQDKNYEIESRRKASVDYFEECRRKTLEESKTNAPEPIVIQAPAVPKKKKKPIIETEEKVYKPPRRKPAPLWLPDYLITEVKGTYYREDFEKEAARSLEIGDELELWNEPDNRYDRHAVMIVTKEEWIGIGYVDANDSSFVFKNIEYVDKVTVIKKSDHDVPYIKIKIEFKWDKETLLKNRDIIHYDRSKGDEYVGYNLIIVETYNKEVNWAQDYWKDYPQEALSIFQKYSDNERGIAFKHECCKCLRKLKRYEEEIEVIKEILEKIRFPRNPNVSRMEHDILLTGRATFEKRFCVASKLLDGQRKKKKK